MVTAGSTGYAYEQDLRKSMTSNQRLPLCTRAWSLAAGCLCLAALKRPPACSCSFYDTVCIGGFYSSCCVCTWLMCLLPGGSQWAGGSLRAGVPAQPAGGRLLPLAGLGDLAGCDVAGSDDDDSLWALFLNPGDSEPPISRPAPDTLLAWWPHKCRTSRSSPARANPVRANPSRISSHRLKCLTRRWASS
jgi:hypothetical protein